MGPSTTRTEVVANLPAEICEFFVDSLKSHMGVLIEWVGQRVREWSCGKVRGSKWAVSFELDV